LIVGKDLDLTALSHLLSSLNEPDLYCSR
jgi:hypothetical protein